VVPPPRAKPRLPHLGLESLDEPAGTRRRSGPTAPLEPATRDRTRIARSADRDELSGGHAMKISGVELTTVVDRDRASRLLVLTRDSGLTVRGRISGVGAW